MIEAAYVASLCVTWPFVTVIAELADIQTSLVQGPAIVLGGVKNAITWSP
jgi:hypothetical protein